MAPKVKSAPKKGGNLAGPAAAGLLLLAEEITRRYMAAQKKTRGGNDAVEETLDKVLPVGGAKKPKRKVKGGEFAAWEPIVAGAVELEPQVTGGAKRKPGRPRKVHGGNPVTAMELFSTSLGDKIASGVQDMFKAHQNVLAGAAASAAAAPPAVAVAAPPAVVVAAPPAVAAPTTEAFQGQCGHFGGAKKKRTVAKKPTKKRTQFGGDMSAIVGGVF